MKACFVVLLGLWLNLCHAQDSLPPKVGHVEPINMDLIRDLGARKGEKEWNVGFGLNGGKNYIVYSGFVEYEFAPVNKLGMEVEIPFHFYRYTSHKNDSLPMPSHRVDGLKLAAQYTFLVSPGKQLSMAVGYIHEFGFYPFVEVPKARSLLRGMLYNPMFVIAKKWGSLHTLLYTGPQVEQLFGHNPQVAYALNLNLHYMLPGTGSFIGLESNMGFSLSGQWSIIFHPQTKLKLSPHMALGLATGIPANFKENGIGFLARLVYEPK